MSADDILELFTKAIEPYPFGNGHPRFWGWVNSPPAVMGVFADALAAAMNPSCAGGNHAAIYVEHQVLAGQFVLRACFVKLPQPARGCRPDARGRQKDRTRPREISGCEELRMCGSTSRSSDPQILNS